MHSQSNEQHHLGLVTEENDGTHDQFHHQSANFEKGVLYQSASGTLSNQMRVSNKTEKKKVTLPPKASLGPHSKEDNITEVGGDSTKMLIPPLVGLGQGTNHLYTLGGIRSSRDSTNMMNSGRSLQVSHSGCTVNPDELMLRSELARMREQHALLSEELTQSQKNNIALRLEIESMTHRLNLLDEQADMMRRRNIDWECSYQQQKKACTELESSHNELLSKLAAVESELRQSRDIEGHVREILQVRDVQFSRNLASLEEKQRKVDKVSHELESLRDKYRQAQAFAKRLLEENENLIKFREANISGKLDGIEKEYQEKATQKMNERQQTEAQKVKQVTEYIKLRQLMTNRVIQQEKDMIFNQSPIAPQTAQAKIGKTINFPSWCKNSSGNTQGPDVVDLMPGSALHQALEAFLQKLYSVLPNHFQFAYNPSALPLTQFFAYLNALPLTRSQGTSKSQPRQPKRQTDQNPPKKQPVNTTPDAALKVFRTEDSKQLHRTEGGSSSHYRVRRADQSPCSYLTEEDSAISTLPFDKSLDDHKENQPHRVNLR